MAKNSSTTVVDAEAIATATEDKGAIVADTDRSGDGIDFNAAVQGLVDAFQPFAEQLARLEKANDQFAAAGYAPRDRRTGEIGDIRSLKAVRASIAYMARTAVNLAEGSARYPDGTKTQMDRAEFEFERELANDGESVNLDRLAAFKRVTEHTHFNLARPLAAAMEGVYELMLGIPMERETAAQNPNHRASAAKKKVEIDF